MVNWKNGFVLFLFIFITTIASQSSYFSTENIGVGDVSDKAIYSPKTHRYLDEDATNKMKDEALSKVQAVYNEDASIYKGIESNFDNFIESIITYKEKKSNLDTNIDEFKKTKNFNYDNELQTYRSNIQNPFSFSDSELDKFIALDNKSLEKLSVVVLEELKKIFNERVTYENLKTVVDDFKKTDVLFYFFDRDVSDELTARLSLQIKPNFTLDEVATKESQNEAIQSVDAVYKEIKKGEVIVRTGEVVSEEQYKKMVELGLVSESFSIKLMLAKLPYFTLIFGIVFVYIAYFYKEEFQYKKQYLFLLSALSLSVILADAINDSYFTMVPVITVLMIFAVFWGRRFLMFSSIIISLMISNGDYFTMSITLITGLVLTVAFHNIDKRINIIIAGLSLGLILAVSEAILFYAFDVPYDVASNLSLLFSGCVAAILTVGLIPVVENILGTVTSLKLYELSDPNHPLLKRLLTEAIGTYTHSLMVANLAEFAADKVGANGMMLRVAAYFHDVGKLKNPEYFIENSTPETNPHKYIDPVTSANIIRTHPLNSVSMCREYKIPEKIISMIECHHGNAVLYHLYNPAKEKNPNVSIEDFRYQTSKPKTKEDGILLLADSTEAFSRVLKNEPMDVIEKKIREMINSKIEHGILSECDLTLRDLDDITEAFVSILVNSNHERIAYTKKDKS